MDTVALEHPGHRPQDEEALAKVIARFVEQHSARDRKSGLLVREEPAGICPIVLGLPDSYDAFVTRRLVTVAKSVGIPVQELGKCDSNIQILFTDDPQGVVNILSDKTRGGILGFHYVHEKRSIVHVWRPVQAWYVNGTRDDSHAWGQSVDSGGVDSSHSRIRTDFAYGPGSWTGTGTHIVPRSSSYIVNALIVADLNKVGGQQIGPLADYITLLALSQPDSLDGCSALASILDLLSSGCKEREKPQALTDSDMAFLKSLYAADISMSGAFGRENVGKAMTSELMPSTK